MTTRSGIALSSAAEARWTALLAQSSCPTRIIKIVIEDETMVFAKEIEAAGTFEADFTLFDSVLKPGEPAYFLYRTAEADSSTFILYTYVPDTAPVRSKMIYASTRSTLIRSLGQQRISTTIFATTPDDLTAAAFARHERHLASAAPMTEREKEQEAMKLAENSTRDGGSNGGRSMVFGKSDAKGVAVGLAWSDAALEATKEFVGGEKAALYFEIDIKLEQIILAEAQPASLALPTNSPSYLLYRHDSRIVFIYSCPDTSPIKSRLLYSSSVNGTIGRAKTLGVVVDKKIETSDPTEITPDFLTGELGPLLLVDTAINAGMMSSTAPLPPNAGNGEQKAFARPSRPGRK